MRDAGLRVETYADHLPPDATDPEWLSFVGQKGWVALSRDNHIRNRPLEVKAVYENRVAFFVLRRRDNLSGDEIASVFIDSAAKMLQILQTQAPPFICEIKKNEDEGY